MELAGAPDEKGRAWPRRIFLKKFWLKGKEKQRVQCKGCRRLKPTARQHLRCLAFCRTQGNSTRPENGKLRAALPWASTYDSDFESRCGFSSSKTSGYNDRRGRLARPTHHGSDLPVGPRTARGFSANCCETRRLAQDASARTVKGNPLNQRA